MSMELILGLLALFGTAAIGTPVAYSIIVGVIVYLGVASQDIAIAGEPWSSGSLTRFCFWRFRCSSCPPIS